MVKEEKFLLNKNTGEEIDIKQSDFEFVQQDAKIHDTKFKSKATTFFKDSIKRFLKSKSATAGGIIVGLLVLLAIVVPFCTPNVGAFDVDRNHVGGQTIEKNVQPKLFPSGTGFWDGTIRKKGVLFDESTQRPQGYREGVFSELETYTDVVNASNALGKGGYVCVFCPDGTVNGNMYSPYIDFDLENVEYTITYSTLNEVYPGYVTSPYRVLLQDGEGNKYTLSEYSNDLTGEVNINDALGNVTLNEEGKFNARFMFEIQATSSGRGSIILDDVIISSTSTDSAEKELLDSISFTEGNELLLRTVESGNAWTSTSGRNAYKVNYTYCNFLYDQYEDIYGNQEMTISSTSIVGYQAQGEIQINLSNDHSTATADKDELAQRFKILDLDNGLIVEVVEQIGDATYNASRNRWDGYTLRCIVRGYRYYGYDSMPIFIFGTNSNKRDYCKLIFTSMRFSFLLAIGVSAVNIIVGLVWGSISGYFGGWTDIIMERIVEIVGSLPATVVITLCIMYGNQFNWGSASDVIALMVALFLTGWMGVAARTRTQFYRFKGREYVLASRTLGAKDSRLIFRHILPNSMGTIITGSILMIPSVIYTEASIAYLGLGLSGQNMFGVILSEANSNYMGETTYILIIPTVLMALLLISFNLFGNGLRDAFNPQLKGGEQ